MHRSMYANVLFLFIIPTIILAGVCTGQGKNFSVQSPDGKSELKVSVADRITISIVHNGQVVFSPSSISMELLPAKVLGRDSEVKGTTPKSVKIIVLRAPASSIARMSRLSETPVALKACTARPRWRMRAMIAQAAAYPFGIIGVILVMLLLRAIFRVNIADPAAAARLVASTPRQAQRLPWLWSVGSASNFRKTSAMRRACSR